MSACAPICLSYLLQVIANVRDVLDHFNFGVDKCGVTRTVFVDRTRTGPFQAFTPRSLCYNSPILFFDF